MEEYSKSGNEYIEEDPKIAEDLFENNNSRLCMCECGECSVRSPHPVYNCFKTCENAEIISEQEKLKMQVYKQCLCSCSYCLQGINMFLYKI
jgi:hypothetical protein